MTAIGDRYDRNARLYERWWAPVLAPSAAQLLDWTDAFAQQHLRARGALRILDLGTGTGALAIDAAARWPGAEIVGVDVARGMLSVARRRAAEAFGSRVRSIR